MVWNFSFFFLLLCTISSMMTDFKHLESRSNWNLKLEQMMAISNSSWEPSGSLEHNVYEVQKILKVQYFHQLRSEVKTERNEFENFLGSKFEWNSKPELIFRKELNGFSTILNLFHKCGFSRIFLWIRTATSIQWAIYLTCLFLGWSTLLLLNCLLVSPKSISW